MSTGETEKTTGCASGDDEDWLYGDTHDDVDNAAGDDDDNKTETEIFSALVGDVEGVNQGADAGSDSDSDDNLCVTIGNIKTGRIPSASTPVNLKTSGITTVTGSKVRAVALVAVDSIIGTPALEVDEELEEKPWRKPGADLSDYFNYGFNEDTWKAYCDKQRRLRMSLEFMTLGSSKKNMGGHDELMSKSDSSSRNLKSSINVIGGQTETIIRVEGRRQHSTDGSNTQVQSSEQSVDAVPPSSKPPPFFAPVIPPPPFPFVPISTTTPFIQHPPRPPMSVPPPGFPLPPEVPSPPFTSGSGRSGGSYDGHGGTLYPFTAGVFPHALGHMSPWPGLGDRAKLWKYYSCQDKERERGKDRERTRERERDREPKKEQERERDQENTPSLPSRGSDKERASRHRDHSDRERHREHDREERKREDRDRERRHRDRNERHKSSRSSSSRRRHSSDDGESHRRHRYKRSKRSKDSTDTESTD